MKVLVTGARGQVGTELILLGKKFDLHMLATDREELDITRQKEVADFISREKPDIVINAAAFTAVDKAEQETELAFSINRDGPSNLALSCADYRIPLLHLSTDYVFDGTKEGPYEDDDKPNPKSIYGLSKLEGENAVKQHLDEYIILRVAWVFGATGHNFVRTMLRLGSERDNLKIVADQQGNPTWARDIAEALLLLVQHYQKFQSLHWGTYHYTGTPSTTWYGLAQRIFELAKEKGLLTQIPNIDPITTEEYPTPAPRPANSILNCEKFNREFQIAQAPWNIGLNNVLNSWKTK